MASQQQRRALSSKTHNNQGEGDFGLIRPSLIKQLRSILDQYPDDGQILKELLQNAEDAKASKVCFLYDNTQYGTEPGKLAHPDLAIHQGPALYAYNDAMFDEKDWTGIRMLQDSIKVKDPMKVGRFGLGFKSVFHMTDMPSVISGEWLAFIDPHEKYFKFQGDNTTGYRYSLKSRNVDLVSKLDHQTQPYRNIFGCDQSTFSKAHYNGTLFRFPLRTQATPLSDTLYSSKKMEELFQSFERDAHLILLFLKHIESVELCMRTHGGDLVTRFKVQVCSEAVEYVRSARKQFLEKISGGKWLDEPVEVVYPLRVETLKYQDGAVEKRTYTWLISEYLAGGTSYSQQLKVLCTDENLSNIPLVGVALPLDVTGPRPKKRKSIDGVTVPLPHDTDQKVTKRRKSDAGSTDEIEDTEFEPEGQVFCFLPLPVEEKTSTGLPVHVNGYFSISQNRRHLKWPNQGQDCSGDKALLWNQCLLKELLPVAYLNVVLQAVKWSKTGRLGLTAQHVMAALPDLMQVDARERWRVILEPFYTSLFNYNVLFSPAQGGQWVSVSGCVFDCLREPSDTRRVVTDVLLHAGAKVVKVPQHVMLALGAYCSQSLESISPILTRYYLHHNSAYTSLSRDEKLTLLAYILKDEDFTDLSGISLLPTADLNFLPFSSSKNVVYVPNHDHPREVLKGLDNILIAADLPETVMNKFNKLAFQGTMQLRFLDKDVVMKLIPMAIPQNWFHGDVISLQQGKDDELLQWLEVLWGYLRQHSPQDLAKVAGLPILVLGSDSDDDYQVVPLSLDSAIVLDGAMGGNLTPEARNALNALGVTVVSSMAHYVQSHAAVLSTYIKLPLPEDVTEAITNVVKHKGETFIKMFPTNSTAEDKRALRSLLCHISSKQLTQNQIKTLSSLPIFELINSSKSSDPSFVSVSKVNMAAPIRFPTIDIETPLLDIRTDSSRLLAKALNVKVLSVAELMTDVVFRELAANVKPDKLETTINFVIDNLHSLQKEDPNFKSHLQRLPFLQTVDNSFVPVTQLFDPDSEYLQNFFYREENKFPTGRFAESEFLVFLRQLGLKQSVDVQAADVLTSVLQVERLQKLEGTDMSRLRQKSSSILLHLASNLSHLKAVVEKRSLSEWIKDISWMATLQDKPVIYPEDLHLYKATVFMSPKLLLPLDVMPLVGVVAPIASDDNARAVLQSFGVNLNPSVILVLSQLQCITTCYQSQEKAKYLQLIMSIYAYLEMEDPARLQESLFDLKLEEWIWHGDGFTNVDKVVSCPTPLDLRPYLYSLPGEMFMFEKMFSECGVRSQCCCRVLVSVLQDIKEAHAISQQTDAAKARDLQLAIDILNMLKTQDKEIDEALHQRILIPAVGRCETEWSLLPVSKCTYCDTEWLQQGIQSLVFDEKEGIVFIHPNVPTSTAEALQVPTLMSRMLQAEELAVTGFGQYETLTNRIKSLLEDYTDGYSIPKELVQNADDAGATVVKFLYDERGNFDHMTYLLDEGMKECQGPALWAYNDAMFTKQDFENITKLGGATKEKHVDKIGKFGLGFNAVYNMTDVLSFLSGNHLVIFDPHTSHVGRSIKDRSKPGIRIDLNKNKTLIRKLPDQFYPYKNIFGCDIDTQNQNHYKGTLFRFPLRTKKQASISEISSLHYDKHEMLKLLTFFLKGAESLLLFTQNVTRIEVHHLSDDDCQPCLLFAVAKTHHCTISPLLINPATKFDVLRTCASHIQQLTKTKQHKNKQPQVLETSMVVKLTKEITVQGEDFFDAGILYDMETFWLLSFVCNLSLSMSTISELYNDGNCPLAAVAAPLKLVGEDFIPVPVETTGVKASLYCHLPLPIHTGLPVHINGAFATQTNRRYLCELTDDDKQSNKADWNNYLLKASVAPAYVHLLQDLVRLNQHTAVSYMDMWPDLTAIQPNMKPLVTAFYQSQDLAQLTATLLHDGTHHVTMASAVFFDSQLLSEVKYCQLATETFRQSSATQTVVKMPKNIVDTLTKLGHIRIIAQQVYGVTKFFLDVFLPHIKELDESVRDPLLHWALELKNAELQWALQNTECIPCTPDGSTLRKPCELIDPRCKAATLYSEDDGVFPYGKTFKTVRITNILVSIGMKTDFLSWEDLIDRAQCIEASSRIEAEKAFNKTGPYLSYLENKLENELDPKRQWTAEAEHTFLEASSILKNKVILPLATPPRSNPLRWRNLDCLGECFLVSADEAFLSSKAALLSSTYLLADEKAIPQKVQKFLGLRKKVVTLDHVLVQFHAALHADAEKLHEQHLDQYDELARVCANIYAFLQHECEVDDSGDVARMIHDGFHDQACILAHGKFLKPNDIVFANGGDCPPLLYSIPYDYMKFKSLFDILGVREDFEAEDYVGCLDTIKVEMEGKPLKGVKLQKCLRLLSGLHLCMARNGLTITDVMEQHGTVYVPNAGGIMQPSSDLCYNNCPWIDSSPQMNYVHKEVSYHLSTTLGVKTQIKEVLSNHATGIPFGQRERLTNSLKRILDSYPLDQEVLKELVQNADDATATAIHFVKDYRTHSTDHVFEDSWKALQGPALCVYNNRAFTLKDLEGIQRLGEGSKTNDPCKTGQYGIGFSSLYHITDAPSILTAGEEIGEMLCAFDPHCCYVPGATQAAPGMRYTDLDMLRISFPDVFTGYLENLDPSFKLNNSTMFRFPLRTKEMADKSEISKTVVTASDMDKMVMKFKEEALEMLLFTNYLVEIKVSFVNPVSKLLENQYAVFAQLSEEDQQKREVFHKACQQVGRQLNSGHLTIDQVNQQSIQYEVFLTDSEGIQEKWCVTQVLGFMHCEDVSQEIKDAFDQGKLALLPRAGTACLLEKRIHGQPVHDNNNMNGKAFCFLPMPQHTGLPVHINAHFAMGFENRRHLWSFTGVESSYKLAWNNLICGDIIASAYVLLLEAIKCYGLKQPHNQEGEYRFSRQLLHGAMLTYQAYFPKFNDKNFVWNNLVGSVYTIIAATNTPLLPCLREKVKQGQRLPDEASSWYIDWFPPCGEGSQKAFFSPMESVPSEDNQPVSFMGRFKSFFKSSPTKENDEKTILKDVLRECGFNILAVNPKVVENFERSGVKIDYMSPDGVVVFFQSYSSQKPICNLGITLPAPIDKTFIRNIDALIIILKYCVQSTHFSKFFIGMPLLLTNDKVLRVVDPETPVYSTKYSKLFPQCGELFLNDDLYKVLFSTKEFAESQDPFKPFTIEALAECLPRKLPEQYQEQQVIPWKSHSAETPGIWVRDVWTFIQEELKDWSRKPQEEDEEYQVRLAQIKSKVEPLRNWCLVPARKAGQNFLYKVGCAEQVVDIRNMQNFDHHSMRSVINKLLIPELDTITLMSDSTRIADFLRIFTASFDTPTPILNAVWRCYNESEEVPVLEPTDKNILLRYFSDSIKEITNTEETVEQLRALPFYKTIVGDTISIKNCLVYVLPARIPTDDMDSWQSKSGTVFLEKIDSIQPLYNFMGCATLTVLDVYCNFILQHFEYLSRNAQQSHLKHLYYAYLKDNASQAHQLSAGDKERLLESLKTLDIIEDKDGSLHPASYYYDPENVLFSVMMEEERLPPRTTLFRESEWLTFLRMLGLNSHVSSEMCVNFASQIALEAQNPASGNALLKSKSLAEHLLSPDLHHRDDILKQVSTIPFIAAERVDSELCNIYPQYGAFQSDSKHLPYISFQGSYSREYAELVWTCASILPKWADPAAASSPQEREKLTNLLGMEPQPPLNLVVHNLRTLCTTIDDISHHNREVKKRSFKKIYEYLQNQGFDNEKPHNLQAVVYDALANIPCIMIGGTEILAYPIQTTMDIHDSMEIRPYLCKIPYEYGEYKKLFLALGASDRPTFDQYATVLDSMHKAVGNNRLHPNELRLAYKTMKGLFESKIRGSTSSLSLIGENGRFYESTKLVFNDTPWFYDRVKDYGLHFLVDLRECGLKMATPDELVNKLPHRLRPEMLSSYIKETLVDKCWQSLSRTGLAQHIQTRLTSEAFHAAVIRLARHEAHKKGEKLSKDTLYSKLDNLGTVNVYAGDTILTHLVYKDKHVKGSQVEKKCFVEKVSNPGGRPAICNVYMKNENEMGQDMLIPLAEAINSILGGLLRDSVLFLLPVLTCKESAMNSCLDGLNVHMDHSQFIHATSTMPNPGTMVPQDLMCLLQPTSLYALDEYVAVTCADGSVVIGIIKSRLSQGQEEEYMVDIGLQQIQPVNPRYIRKFSRQPLQ